MPVWGATRRQEKKTPKMQKRIAALQSQPKLMGRARVVGKQRGEPGQGKTNHKAKGNALETKMVWGRGVNPQSFQRESENWRSRNYGNQKGVAN